MKSINALLACSLAFLGVASAAMPDEVRVEVENMQPSGVNRPRSRMSNNAGRISHRGEVLGASFTVSTPGEYQFSLACSNDQDRRFPNEQVEMLVDGLRIGSGPVECPSTNGAYRKSRTA